MSAFYNEIEPYAAQWLRNLIDAGAIAPGVVDERSIEDIKPSELTEFTQCHFFAGIGGWSYALRLAGWPDDRPVWTGSCPCQPFSAAGKKAAFQDERHLWPSWRHLINESRPTTIFGEQVANGAGKPWLDLVSNEMEQMGYAFGASSIPACSVGTPGLRQRTWFLANSGSKASERITGSISGKEAPERSQRVENGSVVNGHSDGGEAGNMANANIDRLEAWSETTQATRHRHTVESNGGLDRDAPTDEAQSFWRDADWLYCTDGKWRPVEPGAQQMVDGLSRSMGRLRSLGKEKEVIEHAATSSGFRNEVLRAMQCGYDPQEIWFAAGRCLGIPKATLLLAHLCQHSGELGSFFNCFSPRGQQESSESLQPMHGSQTEDARSSQRWKFSEQCSQQLGDALSQLSQESAPFRESIAAVSGFTAFPLADGIPKHVDKLRAYGNAINPYVAAAFIQAADLYPWGAVGASRRTPYKQR